MQKKTTTTQAGTSDLAVVQSSAPPANFRRVDTGADGFWRGAQGDVLYGIVVGAAHDGLAGSPDSEKYPNVVVVALLSDTIGLYKPEGSEEKVPRVFKEGELIYVNVWHRTREALTSPPGTGVWIKVMEEKKIGGGKTVKVTDTYIEPAKQTAQAQQIASGTAGALPSAYS